MVRCRSPWRDIQALSSPWSWSGREAVTPWSIEAVHLLVRCIRSLVVQDVPLVALSQLRSRRSVRHRKLVEMSHGLNRHSPRRYMLEAMGPGDLAVIHLELDGKEAVTSLQLA